MPLNESQNTKPHSSEESALTLNDLLSAESHVLRRLAEDRIGDRAMAGHYSTTSGHNSGGSHTAHSMAKQERPLDD